MVVGRKFPGGWKFLIVVSALNIFGGITNEQISARDQSEADVDKSVV